MDMHMFIRVPNASERDVHLVLLNRGTFENCLGMCAEGDVIDRPDAINPRPTDTLKICGKNPTGCRVSVTSA